MRHTNQRRRVPERRQRYFFGSLLQLIVADVKGFFQNQLG
jgi:hypothetical protein